jgi:hypothetical protein
MKINYKYIHGLVELIQTNLGNLSGKANTEGLVKQFQSVQAMINRKDATDKSAVEVALKEKKNENVAKVQNPVIPAYANEPVFSSGWTDTEDEVGGELESMSLNK